VKWEETKSWPYPVLRPNSDDYQGVEFQVCIDSQQLPESTELEIEAEFALSDSDLLRLVGTGQAEYLLLVKCSTTHYRREFRSAEPLIRQRFKNGKLAGKVDFAPFLVAVKALSDFRSQHWHADYQALTPQFEAGATLAVDHPQTYWIDTADERSVTSMFRVAKADVPDGQWRCRPQLDHIDIELSERDYGRFNGARSRAYGQPDSAYLLNGVYLPALIWLLMEVDQGDDGGGYADSRWYQALNQALARRQLSELGAASADRLADAQALLELPFAKMPILSAEQIER